MFKIIKPGFQKVFFFGNANHPCDNCGCIFRCDDEDTIVPDVYFATDKESRTAKCPCCNNETTVEQFYDIVEFEKMDLKKIEWSTRTSNCLRMANIRTMEDLLQRSANDLLKFSNFGRKSIAEIKEQLSKYGLNLRDK